MSTGIDTEVLSSPISEASPGGENLELSSLFSELDALPMFGQLTALPGDTPSRSANKRNDKTIDWHKVRSHALEGLGQSRDLRLLSYLAAAAVRLDGLKSFLQLLPVAKAWLEHFPDHVHPGVDGEDIALANCISNLGDSMAIVEPMRRAPFVMNRQLGTFSLRDLDIARGSIPVTDDDGEHAPENQILAALDAAENEDLEALVTASAGALDALGSIDAVLRERTEGAATPNFGRLTGEIERLKGLLDERLGARRGGGEAGELDAAQTAGAVEVPSGTVGAIRSRQDAIRALDAVAAFFREHEPSSAVPLFVDRAKRLIGRDFLDAISDIVPDALAQVRRAGGLRDES